MNIRNVQDVDKYDGGNILAKSITIFPFKVVLMNPKE